MIETSCAAVAVSVAEAGFPEAGSVAVIVVDPAATVLASPLDPTAFEIVATLAFDEDQVTTAVRSWVVESVYVPIAVNCWFNPRGTVDVAGVTAIETSCAAVAVSVAEADFPEAGSVAVMVVDPAATELASPFDPVAFETVATLAFDEDQVTPAVRSWVVESVYVPVAVNCCFTPRGTVDVSGVTAIERSCAAVAVSVAEVDFPEAGSVAVMVLDPAATVLASPFDPAAFETVATLAFDEDQVTAVVRSWVVESVYVAVAANCWFTPSGAVDVVGVTAIETTCAAVAVSVAEADFPEAASVAVMVLDPAATVLASPFDPAAFETVATPAFEEDQATADVRSWVVESVYVAVAVNCWFTPSGTIDAVGVIAIETSCAAVTVSVAEADIPEVGSVAVRIADPGETLRASPFDPALFETVTTAVAEELQSSSAVMSRLVASENTAIPANGLSTPTGNVDADGESSILSTTLSVTVMTIEPEQSSSLAEMVA